MRILAVTILLFCFASSARAVLPDEMLPSPELEARAREISRELRCPVCQGQSIDDSGAELAADLRRVVRERLTAGDTDEEIFSFLRARYGDYVLMNPPMEGRTAALWLAPGIVFLTAFGAALVFILKSRRKG